MDKALFKEGLKEIIASTGRVIINYQDRIIPLWIKFLQEDTTAYYSVNYTDGEEDYNVFKPLTKAQVEELKKLSALDDDDEITEKLAEYSFLYNFSSVRNIEPTHVDLEHPYYLYDVDVAIFKDGINTTPQILKRRVELNNEEYAWLIDQYKIYPYTSFNEIRTLNPLLYNKMCDFIENNIIDDVCVSRMIVPIYTVELTQIKKDALELAQLIKEVMAL